jgi:hypothetical protein
VNRPPIDFGEYYAGNPPDARFAPVLTYPEWLREKERLERRARRRHMLFNVALILAAVAAAISAAWMAVVGR